LSYEQRLLADLAVLTYLLYTPIIVAWCVFRTVW